MNIISKTHERAEFRESRREDSCFLPPQSTCIIIRGASRRCSLGRLILILSPRTRYVQSLSHRALALSYILKYNYALFILYITISRVKINANLSDHSPVDRFFISVYVLQQFFGRLSGWGDEIKRHRGRDKRMYGRGRSGKLDPNV